MVWLATDTLLRRKVTVKLVHPRLADDRLDPRREPGRLTLIARMGAGRVAGALPPLIRAVRGAGRPVLWACDPMHGNTRRDGGGRKLRRLADIVAETRAFFAIAAAEGVPAGGLHVETTAADIAECGDGAPFAMGRCRSACDPRLNREQALALAELAGAELAKRAGGEDGRYAKFVGDIQFAVGQQRRGVDDVAQPGGAGAVAPHPQPEPRILPFEPRHFRVDHDAAEVPLTRVSLHSDRRQDVRVGVTSVGDEALDPIHHVLVPLAGEARLRDVEMQAGARLAADRDVCRDGGGVADRCPRQGDP